MPATRHLIHPPAGWDFRRTVRSHGWYDLPPFRADAGGRTLELLFRPAEGVLTLCALRQQKGDIECILHTRRAPGRTARHAAITTVRSCLRLDEDFCAFHAEARRHPRFRWIAAAGAGRLLRAPTVFEDVLKMLCTTNCSWALTTVMVRNLVGFYGERWDDHRSAFPTPEAIAGTTEAKLRLDVRAGYRAPHILRLAEAVASGRLDVESWRTSVLPTRELYAELFRIRGIGPYAAGNLLKLLGRYEHLGLDSWVRGKYAEIHARGRRVSDAAIERAYRRFGAWRGLFFWLEMTRSWHEEKFAGNRKQGDSWSA